MKRHHPFTPTEHGRLLALKTLLYRKGWDNRFESHQPASHRSEP